MKKLFLSIAGAALLVGSVAVAPETALAAGWSKHHPHRVCRVVVRKKVVWRNHHRHVVRYKVRRCHWTRW